MENPTIGRFLKRIVKDEEKFKKNRRIENFGEGLQQKFHDDVNKTKLKPNEKSALHLKYIDMVNTYL